MTRTSGSIRNFCSHGLTGERKERGGRLYKVPAHLGKDLQNGRVRIV